ncbi:MAG: endonuclease/exonuclease/phosphatase family protein [Actinomycetota bacterium]|nr:endonuclease/exonuclease/phosphatase family protein [Actinomycetota bacterium]
MSAGRGATGVAAGAEPAASVEGARPLPRLTQRRADRGHHFPLAHGLGPPLARAGGGRCQGLDNRVLVQSAGGRVTVAATHLSTDRSEAAAQLDAVVVALRARPGPWLLLGDLNLRPERVVPLLERRGFTVADTSAPTYSADRPFLRIDHVATNGLALRSVRVLDAAPVSDHRPLLVEAVAPPA